MRTDQVFAVINRENPPQTGDEWVHLVPVGEFTGEVVSKNKSEEIVQVVDLQGLERIFADYEAKNKDANWTGYLIDQEHFSHSLDKSSEAMGWIRQIELRGDGIWGKPEWTDLGKKLIENKRYKHLSPVLLVEKISSGANRMRAVALADVGLTNKPRLKTLVPVTNRDRNMKEAPMDEAVKKLCAILSLPADSTEDQLVARVEQVKNRAGEADALKARAETAEKERDDLKKEALNRDADAFVETNKDLIKDPAKMKAMFVKNREAAEEMIGLIKTEKKAETKVLNRGDGKTPGKSPAKQAEESTEVFNRRAEQLEFVEEVKNRKGLPSMAAAWPVAQGLKPDLFKEPASAASGE